MAKRTAPHFYLRVWHRIDNRRDWLGAPFEVRVQLLEAVHPNYIVHLDLLFKAVDTVAFSIQALVDVESVKTCVASVALEEIDFEWLEVFLNIF